MYGVKSLPQICCILVVGEPGLIPQTSKVWTGPPRPLSRYGKGSQCHQKSKGLGAESPSSATVQPCDPSPNI